MAHLIWDWNGTLLCDTDAVLEATNEAFAGLHLNTRPGSGTRAGHNAPTGLNGRTGLNGPTVWSEQGFEPLTPTRYRAAFARPLQRFYANVLGRELTDAEFLRLNELFGAAYLRLMTSCQLSPGASEALARWRELGRTQSLLSLWTHRELVARIAQFGLTDYFVRTDGRRDKNLDGMGGKTEPLRRHLAQLRLSGVLRPERDTSARDVVLIGDTLDDATAANALGVACVLFAGGVHDATLLKTTGAPVAHTLAEAIEIAGNLDA
jgi:phosphoglycolate phosphatase-like HAD superfamily hydrolase